MITLEINSQIIDNFTSISISKSVQNIANAFNIQFDGEAPDIPPLSEITIKKDNNIMLVGFVEIINKSDSGKLTTTISGRSKSGVLIGGSIAQFTELKNKKIDYIVKKIIKDYDVEVEFLGDMGKPIKKFSVEPSEDPYSAIVRLLKLRNLIAFDVEGVLTVRKSSDFAYSTVIDRRNFTIQSKIDYSQLYSEYTVVGNLIQSEVDKYSAKDSKYKPVPKKLKYTAKNYLINIYRPKVIIADTGVTKDTVKKQAEWELQKAIGKATSVSANGYSWTTQEGELIDINNVVPVDSEKTGIVENMLIANINYNYNNSGESISLQLVKESTFV